MLRVLFTLTLLVIATMGIALAQEGVLTYPPTRIDTVVDDYYGTKVRDPYRWLEDDRSPETAEWVKQQNAFTQNYLGKITGRADILSRLKALANYAKEGTPVYAGKYYITAKNDGLRNQAIYYIKVGLKGEERVWLDPNTYSKEGTTSVEIISFSADYAHAVLRVGEAGSDWGKLVVVNAVDAKPSGDEIKWVKFSGAAWQGKGFYYSRYEEPKAGKELSGQNQHQKIYYHQLGQAQSADKLIYSDDKHPLRYFGASTSSDERWLIINASEGTYGDEVMVKDLNKPDAKWVTIFPGFKHDATFLDVVDCKVLLLTDRDAPNKRVVSIDPALPAPKAWRTLVPNGPNAIQSVRTGGGKLFVNVLKDVSTRLYQYSLSGKLEREIALPGLGTATTPGGEMDQKTLFYTFTGFTVPRTTYSLDVKTGQVTKYFEPKVAFDPKQYVTKQVFFPSEGGVMVPMFIIHKADLKYDGTAPTLLYGYGGFNISITPSFNSNILPLLERGGIYAVVNLRGGGEYGEAWHKAGMLDKKQNVFSDCVAAGLYLCKNRYTNPSRLALEGRSNGGLLVGAVINQHPELFRVAFPTVGVLDMLRFHKFTVGWGWVVEYGNAETVDGFNTLFQYSPLHNIRPEVNYPSVMVMTADHDDRVVPAHSFKYAATMQAAHEGKPNPKLIRIDTNSGHGASNLTKGLEASADLLAFMLHEMGLLR